MSLQNKWMSGIKSGGEEIMDRWFSPFTQNVRKVWNSRMDRILDVGCGEGTHVGHLLSRMRRGVVTGIDDNPSCVLKAIENNKKAVVDGRCRIIMGSLEKLPFASDSFDLVTLASEKADIRNPQIVKEAYRVLDEDGTILAMEKVASDEETEPVVPASEILEDAGFTDVTVRCHRECLCVTGRKPIRSGYSAKLLYISGFITENIRLLAAAVGVIIGVGAILFTWWKRK